MNKKGFTLVELLAVILLITLILGLAMTAIISKSKELNKLTDEKVQEIIISSAKSYVNSNEILKKQLNTTSYLVVEYTDLEKYDYLKDELKTLETNNSINYSQYRICVTKDSSYNYNYEVTNNRCEVNTDSVISSLKRISKLYLNDNPTVKQQLVDNGSLSLTYSTLSTYDSSLSNMYVQNTEITGYLTCLTYEDNNINYDVSTNGSCE